MIHHKKSHGGFPPGFEDEKVYPCEVCSEEFLTDKNLAMHKLNTHPSGKVEEKFVCDRCDTGHDYRSARMLLKHYFQVGMSGCHFFYIRILGYLGYLDTWIPWIPGFYGYHGYLIILDRYIIHINFFGFMDTLHTRFLHYPYNG